MYGRKVNGQELELEASGALKNATLVMRDRQTNSWWSIMDHMAIGGELAGQRIEELALGTKTTFGEWLVLHPGTLVLSVDGVEHVDDSPYDNYMEGEGTFRDMEAVDDRLPAKANIYALWTAEGAVAVPFSAFEGVGAIFDLPGGGRLLLHRPAEASVYRSTEAWLLPDGAAGTADILLAALPPAAVRAGGFDTFWYTWSGVNAGTVLLDGAGEREP